MIQNDKSVGEIIAEAREKKGISKRELSRLANISDTELARIESGEREIPNPKTLRKISKYIDINYNDLMYAAGLGFQVTPLNPFLTNYYSSLKGDQIVDAILNTSAMIKNWEELVESFKQKLTNDNIPDTEKEVMEQTIEDTEYQISTSKEIINVLESARRKEAIENAKKN
ncbi:MAG: helix-turn-helix transcriptional regulator [bacterium]|nr:helix-turn-helix transcriptional regulator [Bacilli bacterium]MDO5003469.1 helix-turn-helix transcriptional regulator [bacterium]